MPGLHASGTSHLFEEVTQVSEQLMTKVGGEGDASKPKRSAKGHAKHVDDVPKVLELVYPVCTRQLSRAGHGGLHFAHARHFLDEREHRPSVGYYPAPVMRHLLDVVLG